jgi:hypothetical protein
MIEGGFTTAVVRNLALGAIPLANETEFGLEAWRARISLLATAFIKINNNQYHTIWEPMRKINWKQMVKSKAEDKLNIYIIEK